MDEDPGYDDELDEFVQLLNPTPARNSSVAAWADIAVTGRQSSRLKNKPFVNVYKITFDNIP